MTTLLTSRLSSQINPLTFHSRSVEETPIPEESPLPDDEEAFSVSDAILEYGYAYAAANAESVIYEDADLTAPLFTLKEDGGVLLITEETETAFKVWWLTYADEPLSGYDKILKDYAPTTSYRAAI